METFEYEADIIANQILEKLLPTKIQDRVKVDFQRTIAMASKDPRFRKTIIELCAT